MTSIVSLDVGTSSVRALLFDQDGVEQPHFGKQIAYEPTTTSDGGVEVDPDHLLDLCGQCLDELHGQLKSKNIRPAGVSFSLFWHSFLGTDADGKPTTPIIHLLDTRSTAQIEWLRARINVVETHRRTGCILHTSYWPSKLLWLAEARSDAFKKTRWWISFGEYLHWRLFGTPRSSTSMVSGSGLWNQVENVYDDEMLSFLPIAKSQLIDEATLDQPNTKLKSEYATRWPALDGIPWYPALGDGACNNLGSGCAGPDRYALMVGTTGAMRVVLPHQQLIPPDGLWSYRADRDRQVFGGAISNGGEVFRWMTQTLHVPHGAELETQLGAIAPGSHGLTVLPFLAGERAPYWRADLRAAIIGMGLSTKPVDILRASLESVALRFRQIYRMMTAHAPEPKEVMASGGALLKSEVWTQMMADALGRPVVACAEAEASSRGAALWVLERIGAIKSIDAAPVRTSGVVEPRKEYTEIYDRLLAEQTDLFNRLYS